MTFTRMVPCVLAVGLLGIGSAFAQSTSTSGAKLDSRPKATTTTATTTSTTTHTTKRSAAKTRVWNDTTRLAGLLQDAQTNVTVSATVWTTVANEANALANRIYGSTGGNRTAHKAATELRAHVRELRKAAMAGDAAGVRTHASQAMPFATQLIEWSMS